MKVIKRDGHMVEYMPSKIEEAIEKANAEVEEEDRASSTQIKNIIKYIERLGKKRILVEDIQDIIEMKLMNIGKYELAKRYITYRYTRELVRRSNTTDQSIKELIDEKVNIGIRKILIKMLKLLQHKEIILLVLHQQILQDVSYFQKILYKLMMMV